jgi:hypothetical protein
MSQTKKIGGAYTIAASGGTTIDSELTVTGNLTITGTTTTVSTTNTTIEDKIVVYNSGEVGAGVAGGSGKSGIEIDRGSLANAQFVFDEADDKFKISTDAGASFNNIMVTSSSGLTVVVDDTSPQLGGNLDINGFNITSAVSNQDINIIPSGTGNVVIDSGIRLNDQSAPSAVTGASILYAAATTGGGTGVHFVDGSTTGELVSKTKAIVFGLIF